MGRIAVDIVLIPSKEFIDKAIEANLELLKQYPDRIVLNKENCLPHISLAMGCIDENRIYDIEKILRALADEFPLKYLNVAGLRTQLNSCGEQVTVAEIEKSEALQLLHEKVMRRLKAYFSYDVTSDMLLSSEKISESTLGWIKNYPVKSSFENYSPHITLGYGELGRYSFEKDCYISNLSLCHLGNQCTCRKILASAAIKESIPKKQY